MSIPSSVGRYRIDRVLGSGAFASVWLGHDDALASPVAIKVLSGSLLDDLDVRERFLEEARILRRADSERLVRVHDIGELPDGRPYFVMSYADRGTLADRIRARPLPVSEALALAEEIGYGVHVINRLGVIHRDLKPSNVLFQSQPDDGEKLLIADLGLAKALAHASGAFTLPVGTPGYMSPEQARFGGGLDVRADVYGLGALTYHMLTGRPPGPAPVRVPPSQLRPELSPEIDEVILRSLEVEREKRWPTAEAFAQALTTLRPTDLPQATPTPAGAQSQQGIQGDVATVVDRPPERRPVPPVAPPLENDQTVAMQAGQYPPPPEGQGPPPGQQPPYGQPQQPPYGQPQQPYGRPEQPQGPPPGQQPPYGQPQQPYGQPGPPPADGDEGKTAVFPVQPPPGQQGPPPGHQGPPPGQQGPPPGQQGPPPGQYGPGSGGPPPGGFPGQGTPRDGLEGGRTGRRRAPKPEGSGKRKLLVPLAIAAGILVIAVVGGQLVGNVFGGGGDKKDDKKDGKVPSGFVQISDASAKISVAAPKVWPKVQAPTTWSPTDVGLADTQARPVLRATPNIDQFRNATAKTPGVFVGLTTDVATGKLPPAAAAAHAQCTKAAPENYKSPDGNLSGTITRFTACKTGTPSITEVGLVDKTNKFGAWIRVKEIDDLKVTNQILDTLKLTAP